jgi:hypothetical protein
MSRKTYEAGDLPYSGEYRGPQAFFELLATMNDGLELTLGPTPQYLLADETVAVRSRLKFIARASRQRVDMSSAPAQVHGAPLGVLIDAMPVNATGKVAKPYPVAN